MTDRTTTAGFALHASNLETPPVHIPDESGGAFKTELVLERSPEHTSKILWWHADDPRPEPHNHPWSFISEIINGGYTQHSYWLWHGRVESMTKTLRAGDKNRVTTAVFHVVVDVLPGTVTRLRCGKAAPGNEWGYLDIKTGEYTAAQKDSDFIAKLHALNPHLRGPR